MGMQGPEIRYQAVTSDSLSDLTLFSACHGKFGYCSCMRWRMKSTEYQKSTKETRAAKLKKWVNDGISVGVLAYAMDEPVGWCSIAPRETYEALERYKALPRIDDMPVWSVVCFFVDRRLRRRQVTFGLLRAALDYARSQGANVVEGYPVEPGSRLYTYMGSPATFQKAGFRDVTPPGQQRLVMRYVFEQSRK
jgi:GNAT superfamily N-acetyltransferase